MNATLHRDSWEALAAWNKYAGTRFSYEYDRNNRLTPEQYEAYILAWVPAREEFISEFLLCRGWRQLPGSREWV